jgi:uncharacterized repeat protein (TIGR01451 family)/gliding motility-associated-like protein
MGTKFGLYSIIISYFIRLISRIFWLAFFFLFLFTPQLIAQPVVLDLDYNALSFLNSNRSVIEGDGINDFSQGTVHRFDNLISKNGITVYGLMTIVAIENAEILNFDDDTSFGVPGRFQPTIGILTEGGGSVVYQLQFFNASTNDDVFLQRYCITGIDVDGNNQLNREFIEHDGYLSYSVNNPNQFEISTNTSTGRTRFLGRPTSLSGIGFDNSCSYILNCSNPNNSITFSLGQTSKNEARNYSLQFGSAGGTFSNHLTKMNQLPVAVDDIGIPVNSNSGGTVVSNVLSNDFFNGQPLMLSQVNISILVYATHSGVSLNTATGAITVAPATPAGIYTLKYKICMVTNPSERCDIATVTITVLSADLLLTKFDAPDTVVAGENIIYTLTVTNLGQTIAQNVRVTEIFPQGLSFVSATPTVGTWNISTWNIGTLAVSASETLSLITRVASNHSGNIENTAVVTSSTFDPVVLNNSVSQLTMVTGLANLSITKSDLPDPVIAGNNLSYAVTVTNYGPSDAMNVRVNDNIPVSLNVINTEVTTGIWSTPVWSIGKLESGASATMNIETSINKSLSGKISNTAIVRSTTPDPILENNTSVQVTTINASADLEIKNTSNVDPLVAGEMVVYSIWVKNNGPGNAQFVQLSDDGLSEFQYVQYSVDGGNSYDFWQSPYTIGSFNAGDSLKVLIRGSLNSNIPDGTVVSYTVSVNSSTPDPYLLNNHFTNSVAVSTLSDLSIEATGPASVYAGSEITYTLNIKNNGPSSSYSVVVVDTLSPDILNAVYSIDDGNTWEEWTDTLDTEAFDFSANSKILIRGDVKTSASGILTNLAKVNSSTHEIDTVNNRSSVVSSISKQADLILTKTETIAPLQKSGPVNYLISVLNNGPANAPNVTIFDTINSGLISGAQYYNGTGWVTWTGSKNVGTLKTDSTITIQIRGTIPAIVPAQISNIASVTSSIPDPFPLNNKSTTQTFIGNEADLSVEIVCPDSINAGEQIQYLVGVTNNSMNTDAIQVQISDTFNESFLSNFEYSTNNGTTWKKWTGSLIIDTIDSGGKYTFTMRGDVLSRATGILSNSVHVISNTPDKNLTDNTSTAVAVISLLADLNIVKSILTPPDKIIAGSVIEYLLVVSNKGPSDAPNTLLVDTLSSNISKVEISGNGSNFTSFADTLNIGTLIAGGICNFIVRCIIEGNVSDSLSNYVSAESDAIDNLLTNNTSHVTIAVNRLSDLMISINDLPNPIISGQNIMYNVLVENIGPSDAHNIEVTNVIPVGFKNPLFSVDAGVTWKIWTGLYHIDSLPIGIDYPILIKLTAKNDLINSTVINFSASVESHTDDLVYANNSFQAKSTVQTRTDLLITQFIDNNKPSIDDKVKFLIRVTNFGPSKALSVRVSDFLPSGFQYYSDNGNGSYNSATGLWKVGSLVDLSVAILEITAIVLPEGYYVCSAKVTGDDYDPDYSNNESTVSLIPDVEADYQIAASKNIDSYVPGQTLATFTDGDGAIVSGVLSTGSLPAGTGLNSVSSKISVINQSFLMPGNYSFSVTTADIKGGMTIHPINLKINSDFESVYNVVQSKNVDDYAVGESLATLSDFDGKITSVAIDSGNLHLGVSLNSQTGELTVVNPSLLVSGSFPLTISSVDEKGGKTTQSITLVFEQDNESHYTVVAPKQIENYSKGDTLASVTDGDGEIISAILIAGVLPEGSILNVFNGMILVEDSDLLVAGAYKFRINTIDSKGGKTSQLVTIVIEKGVGSVYTVEPPKNIDTYNNGDTLAFVTNEYSEVNSATIESGIIPPGTFLNSVTGEIVVVDSSVLIAGIYTSKIVVNDNAGVVSSLNVTIEIEPDIESVFSVSVPRNLFSYINGETLASVTDGNGAVVSAIICSGQLPPGVTLNLATGQITIADASVLVATDDTFEVKTTDVEGGITIQQLVLSFVAADLSIAVTSISGSVIAGENLIYKLTVINSGPNTALGVNVTDLLPFGLNFISSNPSVGYWSSPNWNIGALLKGAIATMIIEANVNNNLTDTIINTATVTSLTSDPFLINNSAKQISPVQTLANLSVTLTANPDPVTAGENITYTITIFNNGPSDAINVVLINDLPEHLSFISASVGGVLTGTQVKWNFAELKRGESQIVSLVLNATSILSGGSVIGNKVSLKSDNSGQLVYSNLVDILVNAHSDLSISTIASAKVVQAGKSFTYTINVFNNGPSDATNVRISDELPSSLTFISASGGAIFNNGAVLWLPGRIAKGNSYSCSVEVFVKGNVANGTLINNKATVYSNTSGEPVESEIETVLAESGAELEIIKTVSSQEVIAGNEISYTIKVENKGTGNAVNVAVTDTLPEGLTFISASGGGVLSKGVVTWLESNFQSNLVKSYSLFVRVNEYVLNGAIIRNRAFVGSVNSGGLIESEFVDITVDAKSELNINLRANESVISGENITYTLVVSNNGPSDAFNVIIADTLPAGISFLSASNGGIVLNHVLNWNLASLTKGSSQLLTLVVKVNDDVIDGTQISNFVEAICDNNVKPVESNQVQTNVIKFSVVANDDQTIPINGTNGGTVVENVLTNDLFGSTVVGFSDVDITLVSALSEHIQLDRNTGKVVVNEHTPAGTYQLTYRICLKNYQNVCDEANVSVLVFAPEIKAVIDIGLPLDDNKGGVAVEDVTDNDLLNGNHIDVNNYIISVVTPASVLGIDLNTKTGEVTAAAGIQPGTYNITYRICDVLNPANCDEATVSISILSTEECELLVPTAFSPNDDGIHDYFMIKCIEKYPNASLEVYNRWGNLVYKKEKYGNVDQWGNDNAWWGGYSNRNLNLGNEKLPPGTYFFIIKLNGVDEQPIKGSVFLNR